MAIKKIKPKLKCNVCVKKATNHDILFEKTEKGVDGDDESGGGYSWSDSWRMVQCCGCDTISMIRVYWHDAFTDEDGTAQVETTYFPPRIFRNPPNWLESNVFFDPCPPYVMALIKELYVCLQNNCPAAAAMVTRAIFESIMISTIKDRGSFVGNLKAFEDAGHITQKHSELINVMLEGGHATIHRSFLPKNKDVILLIDILEGVLSQIYDQKPKAEELLIRIPPKTKRANK